MKVRELRLLDHVVALVARKDEQGPLVGLVFGVAVGNVADADDRDVVRQKGVLCRKRAHSGRQIAPPAQLARLCQRLVAVLVAGLSAVACGVLAAVGPPNVICLGVHAPVGHQKDQRGRVGARAVRGAVKDLLYEINGQPIVCVPERQPAIGKVQPPANVFRNPDRARYVEGEVWRKLRVLDHLVSAERVVEPEMNPFVFRERRQRKVGLRFGHLRPLHERLEKAE